MSASIAQNSSDFHKMDFTLSHAHGTVMVLAWMVFTPTGILFSRYGRSLRFGTKRQLLGKAIWFQTHRFILSLASLATLLGFLLILVQAKGGWVHANTHGKLLFSHSILGGIIVCCALVQVWLALFRCHPNSHFRWIFNWTHRLAGFLTFGLSIPTLFLITFVLPMYRDGLVSIVSIWTGWTVIVVILFEIIECRYRAAVAALAKANTCIENTEPDRIKSDQPPDIEVKSNAKISNQRFNNVKLILLLKNIIVDILLSIPLIVLIWKQS